MSIGAPLGLLALLVAPALVAFYFLRRRGPPRRVSALFLWRAKEESAPAGPRWARLNRRLSLLLEVLAVGALAAFLADARCSPSSATQAHTVVVLDGSLSMQARLPAGSAVHRLAIDAARRRLLDAGGLGTVLVTGAPPRVLAGPAVPVREAAAKLDSWLPAETSHAFEPAWTLAKELAGARGDIVFFTDALPEVTPPTVEVVALGTPLPNVGFTAAARDDGSDGTRLQLRLANFGMKDWTGVVSVRDEHGATVRAPIVSIGAGKAADVAVQLPVSQVLTASLPEDALGWDNSVTLGPDPARIVHVRNELPATFAGAEAVTKFLSAASNVAVTGSPDVTIRALDSVPAPEWSLTIGVDVGAKVRAFLGPFVASKSDPLLDDVVFSGAVWPAGPSPGGRAVLSAGDVTLLSETTGHRYRVNLDMGRSNVVRMAAWPVLLANLMDLRRAAAPGFSRRNAVAGETIHVVTGLGEWKIAGGEPARVLAPEGETLTPQAGAYMLEHDGAVVDRLWVSALDAAESDLRSRGQGTRPARSGSAKGAILPRERSAVPLALALALLVLDYVFAAPGVVRRRPRRA